MKRGIAFAAGMLVAAVALLGFQSIAAQSAAKPVAIEELTRHDLAGAEGMEAVVQRARFAPGASMAGGKVIEHPAEEFVYILEGAAVVHRQGEEPVRFEQGEAWYNPPLQAHTLTNANPTEPLRVIAVFVAQEGTL